MSVVLQVRRGTAAEAAAANRVLAVGEFGFETDTYQLKGGDGSTAYNSLPYIGNSGDLRTAQTFGASLDGSTNDQVALQLWIDYLESQATFTGAKVRTVVKIPKDIRISAGINIDCSKVHLNWGGSRIIASSAVTGVAITLTSTNGDESAKGTQIMGGMSDLRLRGANNTTGTGIALVNGGIGPAHVTLERVMSSTFEKALDLTSSNVYLNRFLECNFSGSSWGIYNANSANSGEKHVFERCVLGANLMALYLREDGGDITFSDCSFDFNSQICDAQNGVTHFRDCHFEQNSPANVLFIQGAGGRSHMKFSKCTFWFGGDTSVTVENPTGGHGTTHLITCAGSATVHGEGCEFFNSRTSTGELATGNVYFEKSVSHDNTLNNFVVSTTTSMIDGTFETGIPLGISMGGTDPSRLINTGGSLSLSATKAYAGTQSLAWTKTSAVNATDANIVIFAQIPPGFMKSLTSRFRHSRVSGTSENWFLTEQWVSGYIDATGRLVVLRSQTINTTGAITSDTTWKVAQFGGFTNAARAAPSWANFYRLSSNNSAWAPGTTYIDDLTISPW